MWRCVLEAVTTRPGGLPQLLPILTAPDVLVMKDLRHPIGKAIESCAASLSSDERTRMEGAILAISENDRDKQILAACIPDSCLVTEAMTTYRASIDADRSANEPPCRFYSSSRVFDSEAYYEEEGVAVEAPANAALRTAEKAVESEAKAAPTDLDTARCQLDAAMRLLDALQGCDAAGTHTTLIEHAEGVLSDCLEKIACSARQVMSATDLRQPLSRGLLHCARSANPHVAQNVEDRFHESLSWGGPSARTNAAQGLVCLVRFDETPDAPLIDMTYHALARDPVCHVRFSVIRCLYLLHRIDGQWTWSELEHVLRTEPTRGVVSAAIETLSRLTSHDPDRVLALAKLVLDRYLSDTGAGIDACRKSANTLIANVAIYRANAEAGQLLDALISDIPASNGLLGELLFHFSGDLMIGAPEDAADIKHAVRGRVLAFYAAVLDRAMAFLASASPAPGATQTLSRERHRAAARDLQGHRSADPAPLPRRRSPPRCRRSNADVRGQATVLRRDAPDARSHR